MSIFTLTHSHPHCGLSLTWSITTCLPAFSPGREQIRSVCVCVTCIGTEQTAVMIGTHQRPGVHKHTLSPCLCDPCSYSSSGTVGTAQHPVCKSLFWVQWDNKAPCNMKNTGKIKGAFFSPWLPPARGSLGLGICYWMYNAECFVLNWSWWGALKACSLVICLSSYRSWVIVFSFREWLSASTFYHT